MVTTAVRRVYHGYNFPQDQVPKLIASGVRTTAFADDRLSDYRENGLFFKDTVTSDEGDDTIRAGAGDDRVYGGGGADTISGEDGIDILYGEDGNDIIDWW